MTGATGTTFLEVAALGSKSINIPLHTGGNVIGIVAGYDGVFLYVNNNENGKLVGVPVWNIQLAQLTN